MGVEGLLKVARAAIFPLTPPPCTRQTPISGVPLNSNNSLLPEKRPTDAQI